MNADTSGPSCQPFSGHANGAGPWGGRRCAVGWKPVEILAMVLGFIVFWPIGLAVLAWKFWQRKTGYEGDIVSFAQEKWGGRPNFSHAPSRWWKDGSGMTSTGNVAFDDWRASELARLEQERQKLVEAERDFADYIDNLRRARDREEFGRFMDQRRSKGADPASQAADPSV